MSGPFNFQNNLLVSMARGQRPHEPSLQEGRGGDAVKKWRVKRAFETVLSLEMKELT